MLTHQHPPHKSWEGLSHQEMTHWKAHLTSIELAECIHSKKGTNMSESMKKTMKAPTFLRQPMAKGLSLMPHDVLTNLVVISIMLWQNKPIVNIISHWKSGIKGGWGLCHKKYCHWWGIALRLRVCSQPWMKGKGKQPKGKHPTKKSMERYKKCRYCPVVPGCFLKKHLKKLTNHFKALHPELSKDDRRRDLKCAKYTTDSMCHPVQAKLSSQPSLEQWVSRQSEPQPGICPLALLIVVLLFVYCVVNLFIILLFTLQLLPLGTLCS